MSLQVIINEEFNAPLDKEQLAQVADFSFDNFSPNPTPLKAQTLEFRTTTTKSDPVAYLKNYIETVGIYTNPTVRYADSVTGLDLFNGYIDLAESEFFLNDKIYQMEVKPDVESFFETAGALNLRELYKNNNIPISSQFTEADFDIVKYVISSVPNTGEAAAILLSLAFIGHELLDAGKTLAEAGIDLANPFTSLNSTAKIIFYAIYYGILITSLYLLLKNLSDTVFQKIKDYYCINVKVLMEKACKYLGYELNTTLFDGEYARTTTLPATGEEGAVKGKPTNNPIPNKTLLRVMEDVGKLFNAKLKVESDRTITYEKKSFFLKNPINAKLPRLKKDPSVKFNLKDNYKTINLSFRQDPIEKNTYLSIEKLGINLGTEPVSSRGDKLTASYTITDQQDNGLNSINNTLDVDMGFSRFFRKDFQTGLEKTFNSIYDSVVRIADLFRKDKQSEGRIGDRIGYGLLDNDFVGTDKIFILANDGKISKKSFSLIHCEKVFENYRIDTLYENQRYLYSGLSDIPICDKTTVRALRDNNVMLDEDGRTIHLTKNERDLESGMHKVEYSRQLALGDFGFIPDEKIIETITVE